MINLDLERKILNGLCTYEDLTQCCTEISREWFYDTVNRKVFDTIKQMYLDNSPITLATVAEAVSKGINGERQKWAFINSTFMSQTEIRYVVAKLKQLYKMRSATEMFQGYVKQIEADADIDELLQTASNDICGLASDKSRFVERKPGEIAISINDSISQSMDKKGGGGIKTSFAKLNRATNGGHQPGELIIVAGKTGRGKSAFMQNMTRDIAVTQKIPLLYINTELNQSQIDFRLAAITAKDSDLTYENLAMGNLTDDQLQQVLQTCEQINQSKLYDVTAPDLTIDDVIMLARKYKAAHDIKVLVVDYVGRMDTLDPKLKEYQVLKIISKRLKTLSQQLNITVFMLAQLTDEDKLEGAKGMKNECDLMMYLDEMSDEEKAKCMNEYNYFLVIDKNRNGRCGSIPLKFIGEKMLFTGGAKDGLDNKQQEQGQDNALFDGTGRTAGQGWRRKKQPRRSCPD